MTRKSLSKIALLSVLVTENLLSARSYATGVMGLGIGALGGWGMESAGGSNSSGLNLGGDLTFKILPSWSIGAEFTTFSFTPLGVIVGSNLSTVMGSLNFHFPSVLNPLYLGVKGGVAFGSTPAIGPIPATTTSSIAFGAQAGYDFNLFAGLTVGPRVTFDMLMSSTATSSFTTLFQGLGVIKYWL